METSLHYNQKDKHLSFLLKETATGDQDIQLRFRGRLNTNTGGFEYHATAQKFVGSGPVLKVGLGPSCNSKHACCITATAAHASTAPLGVMLEPTFTVGGLRG